MKAVPTSNSRAVWRRRRPLVPLLGSVATLAALALSACLSPEEGGGEDVPGTHTAAEPIRVLLIDGQNNHAWKETTPILVEIFEATGKFEVEVSTSPPAMPRPPRPPAEDTPESRAVFAEEMRNWETEAARLKEDNAPLWDAWSPDFDSADVVVSNYNGELWPERVRLAFETYVAGGGGFVSVHAANNSFPEWRAYNEMIGLGGWGGRNELSGPYLRRRDGEWVEDETPGRGGAHGRRHEFVVEIQDAEHPVTRGLPSRWMHAEDELYDRLRGPAANLSVLAAAYASEETGGSGEWEPLIMAISYGAGRVFHTALGHDAVAMAGRGFQETLNRGTEWAATGSVSFPPLTADDLPEDRAATVEASPVEADVAASTVVSE